MESSTEWLGIVGDLLFILTKMEQSKPGDISATPSSVVIKQKRGRPRKDHGNIRASTEARSRLQGFNNIQSDPTKSSEVSSDSLVGLTVSGVVEASFDAGYMLKVRIGDSDTCLRGVVFKPGHYVPITSENDIAPQVQMIQRTKLPSEKVRKVRRSGGSRRKQDGNNNMTENVNKNVSGKSLTPPVGSRDSSNSCKPMEEEENEDMNEPLYVEPLQTIHTGFNYQTPPISRPNEYREMGRMSELLEVLHDKLTE